MTEHLPTELPSASTPDAEVRASYVNPGFDDEASGSPARVAIDAILDMKIKAHKQNNMVIDTICDDLATLAEFFREDITDAKYHPRLYLRMRKSGEVLDLFEATHLDDILTSLYGLQLKTSLLKTVAEHVCQKVRRTGKPVTVCSGHHYDANTSTMYISVDPLRVLRMSTSQVEYVANVVDGLLFLPSGEPIDVDLESIRSSDLGLRVEPGSLMYDYFDATYADETIRAEYNHQLVCTRILALFFPDLFTSRSLLILDGEPGCGKTILARKSGWLMQGSKFEVSILSSKKEDMETLLTSDPLVVLDNLDEPALIRRYTSLLCQTVTGGKINKRQLYSNHVKLSYPLIASVICTSIDLGWVRNTIADRALIIQLAPRVKDGQNTPDVNIMGEALKMRNVLMTEVLGRCRNILIALETQAAYNPPHILRLHDFTGFMLRCAVHEDWADTGLDILRAVARAQHEEADANNPMHDVIRQYIGRNPEACRDHLSATAIGMRFKRAAEELMLDAKFEWGPYGMRGVLNKQFSSLRTQFGLRREDNPRCNSQVFWFEPTPDQLETCYEFARQSYPHSYVGSAIDLEAL
jgi:hypothetical protein